MKILPDTVYDVADWGDKVVGRKFRTADEIADPVEREKHLALVAEVKRLRAGEPEE